MNDLKKYELIAELFRYPKKGFRKKVSDCQYFLEREYPEAAIELMPFSDYMSINDMDELEELYTRTFDVQPISYLDIGYVLFVEDYKRGDFLAHMKREQDNCGNDYGTELPDNLVNVLTLLPKLEEHGKTDVLNELMHWALVPALVKIIAEFDEARVAKKIKIIKKLHKTIIRDDLNTGNVYQHAFRALLIVISEDFDIDIASVEDKLKRAKPVNNFLKSRQEVNLETNINT